MVLKRKGYEMSRSWNRSRMNRSKKADLGEVIEDENEKPADCPTNLNV